MVQTTSGASRTGRADHRPSNGQTRTEEDFLAHIRRTVGKCPQATRRHFVVDNLDIHRPESWVRFVADHSGLETDLGVKYKSGILQSRATRSAFLSDPSNQVVFHVERCRPCGRARPGSRAPHLWLERDDRRISTLDLFGRSLVLLTGQNGHGWCRAAECLAGTRRVPLQAVRIATDGEWHDPERTWAATYGVVEAGAVLVRPDGYVAWRAAHARGDLQSELDTALAIVLGWK